MKRIKNYLYLLLSQHAVFWSIQSKINNFIFKTKKANFNSKRFIENKKETYETYTVFKNWSFLNIFFIVLGTYFLQIVNPFIEMIFKFVLNEFMTPTFVSFKLNSITDSEYVTFLGAIATLGGVFIALYFSSLSAINATLYSTFSNNLRDLLYREKLGNSYIKFLSNTTFFAFSLIVFFLLGYEKIYIAIPIMLFLIGMTIFSYIELGMYTSKLLNVDTLSNSIFMNLYKYINNSIKQDMYHQDKNFQNHRYTLASQELELLRSLVYTSLVNYKIHNDSLYIISLSTLRLLTYYQGKKRLIPYESLWYKQKVEYKDLYKPGNTGLNIFLQSATMPQGDRKYNLFWIEEKLIPYTIKILINKIQNNEIEHYKNILSSFDEYLSYLVQFGNIEYAIKIITRLKENIYKLDSLNHSEMFELIQYIYSLPLNIIFNFYHNINIYSYSDVSTVVNSNNLAKDNLQDKFQENSIESLNWLQKRLKIEYEAENGKEITPKWYQIEILMLTISRNFISNIESIDKLLNEFFNKDLENKDLQLYSIMLTQKWETINKYIIHYQKIEEILNEYQKERKIDGLNWKKFSIEKLKEQNNQLRKETILEIGKILHKIGKREDENFPDIFGYFLQLTSDNLLELSIEKNFVYLKEIYPSFLFSSLIKYEELRPEFNNINEFDWRKENEFIVSFHPIMNLIEITGLIKTVLEFNYEQETWIFIEKLWLDLFNNAVSTFNVQFLETIIFTTESAMGMPIGDEQRFNWKNKVKDYLEANIERDSFVQANKGKYSFMHHENIILHDSALIREFLGDEQYGNNIDGIDVFIYSILNKNFKDKNFNFGWKRNNKKFEDSMKRNTEIYEEYQNARK
ncbi:hypothetical protein CVO_00390 [Sulfurimonas sp. CVO]|uniref:hypothetical protein n=1 Tax=Sulfurimonas sp. CVO TaxID=2283483 RepID=UPI00132EB332|nr:hypothetical protein [Sulfurimonas sp. CVO]QHG90383.1 hypothetical protein CVO_00390 [Sulfurimonas sp. CVO]